MKNLLIHLLLFLLPVSIFAQGGGYNAQASAGYYGHNSQPHAQKSVEPAAPSEFITITGTAEVSLKPESLRLVFAVTAEAESSVECSRLVKQRIAEIREGIQKLELDASKVVEDFIVVVPSYTWELQTKEKTRFVKEVPNGFRMQSNLHILCDDEAQAMAVIDLAFAAGVTEIISFDYWHSELDAQKQDALKQALEAAKAKSEVLLAVFDEKPRLLNIDNSIKVSFPVSQYKTITPAPANDEAILPSNWRHDMVKIRAQRPKTTFYAGNQDFTDTGPGRAPMSPEISVISTVTLTYTSPAREERLEIERLAAENKSEK